MAFRTNAGPYQRSKRTTTQTMLILTAALLVVWLCAVITSFVKLNSSYGVKSILMMVVALIVTAACDAITALIRHQKGGKTTIIQDITHTLIYNYSYVTAIIFTLTLPVWTSYYVVIIGSIFATVVVKNLFGGFGNNIFNPALMARIFVGLCFASMLSATGVVTDSVDAVTGATLTTQINGLSWLSDVPLNGFTLTDLLFGNYFGAMGETFTIVLVVIGIVLAALKVINWRTPVFYLGTVALTSLGIALIVGFENPFTYMIYQLSLGGLMFGAVFMITDPVTGPTSPFGKSLIGVLAGFLTVLIRVKGGYPEGVMYSIAVCNLISPAIDYFTVGKSSSKLGVKYGVTFGTMAVAILLCGGLSYGVNGGKEVYHNGIEESKYNEIIASGFTLSNGDDLAIGNGKVDYFIVNKDGKNVAAVYYVIADEQKVPDAKNAGFKLSAYIAINLENDSFYYAALENTYVVIEGYGSTIEDYASSTAIGMNKTDFEATTGSASTGATYSYQAFKDVVLKAYAKYAAYKA